MRIISPDFLKEIKRKALRRHVWFSAIDVIERGIVNLTIDCVERIESLILSRVLMNICKKINYAYKSVFTRNHEVYGFEKAVSIVEVAIGFGSESAKSWLNDSSFSMFLTLNHMYRPIGWG